MFLIFLKCVVIVGLKSKQWVRLKRGLYKDDIAQVDYFDMAQNQVHLKLLPRIDYTRLRGALKTTQSVSSPIEIKVLFSILPDSIEYVS